MLLSPEYPEEIRIEMKESLLHPEKYEGRFGSYEELSEKYDNRYSKEAIWTYVWISVITASVLMPLKWCFDIEKECEKENS